LAFDKPVTKSICSSVSCTFDVLSFVLATDKRIGSRVGCTDVVPLDDPADVPGVDGATMIGGRLLANNLFRTVDVFKADEWFGNAAGSSKCVGCNEAMVASRLRLLLRE